MAATSGKAKRQKLCLKAKRLVGSKLSSSGKEHCAVVNSSTVVSTDLIDLTEDQQTDR